MSRLVVLVVLAMALAFALPDTAQATSLNEFKKLTASDAESGDIFGWSVAVSGDSLVVGALGGGADAGAVYLFQRDYGGADNWGEFKKFTAADAQAGDQFGISVAVSGDTLVVGALGNGTGGAGAAYVFQRDEGGADNWGQVAKLNASDAQSGNQFSDQFGASVAVSGDIVAVGAAKKDAGADIFDDRGAAYVFQRDEGGTDNWGEVKILTASNAQPDAQFGSSVALDGDAIVVGAIGEATGGTFAGAAYVFQRNQGGPGNWGEDKKLIASDAQASNSFGRSVAISGDTIVVGAGFLGSSRTGAYVFQRDEGGANNWGEVKKLAASDAEPRDQFGLDVAVSSDTIVVGAFREDSGGHRAGAAYAFRRDEGSQDNWGEVTKLAASDIQANDSFGTSVAVSSDTAFVGAMWEDAQGTNAGAAYVFDLLLLKPTPTITLTPTVTPTPTPTLLPGVGGIALDSDLRSLPLETNSPDRSPWGVVVAIVAAAAVLVIVGGAAWYARRRSVWER